MRFALKGKGHLCSGGVAGNLYIVVSVKKHEMFDRLPQGNLLCRVPVSYTELVFGHEMDVPTLDGKVNFKIPEGTQPGTKFRLKGLGLPIFNNRGIYNSGDELIQVDLEVPTNLSDEHKSILQKLSVIEQGE
jgi:molecular chaperone DnaJ